MEKLKNLFDDFTIAARVMPALTIVAPFLLIALYRGVIANSWSEASVEFVIALVLIMYGANIARERGKDFEEKMFKELGALPTTIVMRFSDGRIDGISKKKYHQWLNEKDYGYQLPLSLEEERMDNQSDVKYINAMKNLRIYANAHRDEIPRVYQELKKYNYWRNLYGCKKIAVVFYVCTIALESFPLFVNFGLNWLSQPVFNFYVLIGMVVWTLGFCLMVTQDIVKRNAFDYAVTLVETGCGTS